MNIINTAFVALKTILSFKRDGEEYRIGDRVRELRVKDSDGQTVSFYRKDGTYIMPHAGTADVGEYAAVQTAFTEYTEELQAETEQQIETIDGLLTEILTQPQTEQEGTQNE